MKGLFYKCFIVIFMISTVLNAQSIEDSIVKTVEQQMVSFLSKIPVGSEESYGFNSRDDFKNCKVGIPVKVLTVRQINKKDSLIEVNEWRVPVKLNGQNVQLLTVIKNNNIYEVVDLGGELLAKELQNALPNDNEKPYLLRLFNLHIDFVASCNKNIVSNDIVFKPLNSAKIFLKMNQKSESKTDYKLIDIFDLLK